MILAIGWLWAVVCLVGGAIVVGRFLMHARRPISRQSWGKLLIYVGVIFADAAYGAGLISFYAASPDLLTAVGIFFVLATWILSVVVIGRM